MALPRTTSIAGKKKPGQAGLGVLGSAGTYLRIGSMGWGIGCCIMGACGMGCCIMW